MSLFHLSWRLLWRGAVIWAAVVALMIISGAKAYNATYPTKASRQLIMTQLGSNRSFNAMYGKPVALDNVGGFLSWRYGVVMSVVIGLWALLAATRIMRGDEENGRTDLLVAAPVRPQRLLAVQLAAFVIAALMIGAGAVVGCLASGLAASGSVLFGVMVTAGGLVFGAIAAVTSQLFDTRRRAAGWAGAVLGASYLVRAVGDASANRGGAVWLSPLGWVEKIGPFGDPSAIAIVVVAFTALILGGLAWWLRGRRDTGEGLVGLSRRRVRVRPIRSTSGLDWRLIRGTAIAWSAGVGIYGVVLGFIAADVVNYVSQDQNVNDLARKFGGGSSIASAEGFLGLTFALVGVVLAVFAASQVVAGRQEEGTGRIDALLVFGSSRTRWLAARALIGAVIVVTLAVIAGVTAWLGTVLSGNGVSLAASVRGALNVVPIALLFGGVGLVAFGLLPRATAAISYGAITLAYLVQLIGSLAQAPDWVLDLSPFTHVAPVPLLPANVTAMLIMLAAAVLLVFVGSAGFRHRDVASD